MSVDTPMNPCYLTSQLRFNPSGKTFKCNPNRPAWNVEILHVLIATVTVISIVILKNN